MNILRKLLLVLIAPFFVLLLYATAIDIGFVRIGTHPATIKHILADSGIYNSVVSGLLDQSKQISGGGGDVSLTDPLVRTAATATFTPQLVQTNTGAVLDGTYDWLDGKTPLPDFQIDLTPAKTAFANNVAQAAQQKLAGLPVCTAAQAQALAENFNPLSATCLPQGITAASAASSLQSNILGGKGFLDNPVITADSIKNGNNNQPVFSSSNVKKVPAQYQRAKKTPFILVTLTVLLGLAIIFLSSSRAAGLRRIGWPLLLIGVLLLVFAWAINHITTQTLAPKISVNNAVLQSSLRTLIVDVEQAIDKSYWWFGGAYIALGAAAMGGSMYLKKGKPEKIATVTETGAAPDEPESKEPGPDDEPKTSEKPKSHRTIKVQ